jgi:hypothetical protein
MWRHVAVVRTDFLEERIACIIKVERISQLVAANVVPSSLTISTLMMEAIRYTKTSVLTRATCRNIPEDGICYYHRRENLKSYMGEVFV